MDIVGLLSSLNKIALVAFLVTLGFLIYEIILLRKAGRAGAKPQVPKFQEGGQFVASVPPIQVNIDGEGQKADKKNKLVLLALVILLIFFGAMTLVGYIRLKSSKPISTKVKASVPTRIPTRIPSPTVKIPTPTSEITEPTQSPSPALSEIPLTTEISPTISLTLEASLTPTEIQELPVTGYINNSLILFSVAGLILFFSFLF